jgi:CRP-like cAMP-binding protein
VPKRARPPPFNVEEFLNSHNGGSHVSNHLKNRKVFSQGDPADAVFYIREGKVKICVISERGKEAVVALHWSFWIPLAGKPLCLCYLRAGHQSGVNIVPLRSGLQRLGGRLEVTSPAR